MARHPWREWCLRWLRLASGRDHSFQGNVISSAAANALGLLVGIGTASLLARGLGSHARGEFAAINGWSTFLGAIAAFGLPTATTFFASRSPRHARSVLLTAALAGLPVMALLVVAGWSLLPMVLQRHGETIVRASQCYLVLYAIANIALYVPFSGLQALGAFGAWNLARLAQPILWLVVLSLLVVTGHHGAAVLGVGQAASFVAVAPLALYLFHRGSGGPYCLMPSRVAPMLRYGAESVLASLPLTANRRLDQMIMAAFIDPHVLGLYAVAVSLAALLLAATAPVAGVLMPHLAALATSEAKRHSLGRVSRTTLLVSSLLGLGLLLVSPLLIWLLFGRSFLSILPAVAILVPATVVLSVTSALDGALLGLNRARSVLIAEAVGCGVTVAGLLLTLTRWPLMGAAITSLASYLAVLLVVAVACGHCTGIGLRELLVPSRAEVGVIWSAFRARGSQPTSAAARPRRADPAVAQEPLS